MKLDYTYERLKQFHDFGKLENQYFNILDLIHVVGVVLLVQVWTFLDHPFA